MAMLQPLPSPTASNEVLSDYFDAYWAQLGEEERWDFIRIYALYGKPGDSVLDKWAWFRAIAEFEKTRARRSTQ